MEIKLTEGFKNDMERLCSGAWYWKLYRGVHKVLDFPREVKWFIQRGRRGWADCDIWSLDAYLMSWLPEALRHLAKNVNGCPGDLYDESCSKDDQCHKWTAILIEMAEGFELKRRWEEDYPAVVGVKTENAKMVGVDPYYYNFSDPDWRAKYDEKEIEVRIKFERSKELLGRYWENLWD